MENEACGFSDFDRGAMRQKMAINSVCSGTTNFEWRNFHEFHRGTMRQKMAIFKEGNTFAGVQNFVRGDADENRRENRHFIEGKLVVHYQILNIFEWGRC